MTVMQIFNTTKIMDICRDYNLFTVGTNEEFDEIYDWYNKSYSDEELFKLASHIKKHSDNMYAIHDIAGIILREGITRYIDDEE